jgi:hypothetical protein
VLLFFDLIIVFPILLQATLLLDAFNKDRASLPTPAPPPQVAAVPPPAPPDARTQEMINEKLKKAEELGTECNLSNLFTLQSSMYSCCFL